VAPWVPIPQRRNVIRVTDDRCYTALTKLTNPGAVAMSGRGPVRGRGGTWARVRGKPRPRTQDGCEALSELVLWIPADEEARYA
jgi:hypothetical protein